LTGGPYTILRVSGTDGRWFSPTVGVINCNDPFNIKISNFEIDGNCQNLPASWANSPGHAHDQEQLIKIVGSSGNYGQNIEISNMTLHNSFGDGIQARFIDGIICSENEIINTQHESIYYSACKNCKMINNRMSVITSDGGRFDNCVDGEAAGNIVWQYDGTNNNGAPKGGANAFQVGDAGSSKGYNGQKSYIHSTNIEFHNNTIIDPGRAAFLVDAAGQTPSTNLYIHDNVVVGTEDLEIMGISVDSDISYENPPTQEQSEEVFDSVFDYMGLTSEYSYVSDASYNSYYQGNLYTNANAVDCVFEKHITIDGNYTLIKIDTTDISSITYTINGSVSKHILKIGVRQGMNVIYSDSSIWEGNAEHDIYGNVYLNDTIDGETVSVQCTAPSGDVSVNRVHTVVNDGGISLNVKLLICILIALLPALFGIILLRKLIRSIVMY
jgi:hypothetical protein